MGKFFKDELNQTYAGSVQSWENKKEHRLKLEVQS